MSRSIRRMSVATALAAALAVLAVPVSAEDELEEDGKQACCKSWFVSCCGDTKCESGIFSCKAE